MENGWIKLWIIQLLELPTKKKRKEKKKSTGVVAKALSVIAFPKGKMISEHFHRESLSSRLTTSSEME